MSSAPDGRSVSYSPSWWRRHRRALRWATAWVPILVVTFLLIGFSDIVPERLSGYVTTSGTNCVYCPAEVFSIQKLPARSNVTLRWADESGGVVSFRVSQNATGETVFSQNGGSGTGSFDSLGGYYTLSAGDPDHVNQSSQLVNYTITYYTSLL
jgi:hypothetical protein